MPPLTEDPDEREEFRERAELADRIRSAFATVPRPDPPITEGTGPLNEDVELVLAGREAHQITPADAAEVLMDVAFLKPDAFVYYLPALMRIVLEGDVVVDGLDEAIFHFLTPPEDDIRMRHFERRVGSLDRSQRDALASYVDWYSREQAFLPELGRATAYWHG